MYGYDISDVRREQATKHGVVPLEKNQVERVEHGCEPLHKGFDVVIECAGVNASRQMAVLAAKRWGTVVFIGEPEGGVD